MPRPPRPQIAGAVYHVTARAVDKQALFRDVTDRVHYLRILEKSVRRYAVSCHFYCLMGNHYHLLVRPKLPNISLAIQYLNGRYAQDFNDRHGREGHLLERRFRAVVVETDEQLLTTVRYIAWNPVDAFFAPSPRARRSGARTAPRSAWCAFRPSSISNLSSSCSRPDGAPANASALSSSTSTADPGTGCRPIWLPRHPSKATGGAATRPVRT